MRYFPALHFGHEGGGIREAASRIALKSFFYSTPKLRHVQAGKVEKTDQFWNTNRLGVEF